MNYHTNLYESAVKTHHLYLTFELALVKQELLTSSVIPQTVHTLCQAACTQCRNMKPKLVIC